MGLSPIQQYHQQIDAQHITVDNGHYSFADKQQLHDIALEQDLAQLKMLGRISDKIEFKKTVLLPKYRPMAEQHLASKQVNQDVIFQYVVVWLFDTEQFDTAIEWALIAITQGQGLPIAKRTWPAFIADEVLIWSEREAEKGNSVEPYFSAVFEKVMNVWRLNEALTAKYYKFAGLQLLRDESGKAVATGIGDIEQLHQAKILLETAMEIHPKCGAKTQIDKIAMRLRALEKM